MGAPPLRFLQGWIATLLISCAGMTVGLRRYCGAHHLHFMTWSCYRRQPLLRSATNRDSLLDILEQVRRKYQFVVLGYVVMPEHVHLLMSEPESGNPSDVMGTQTAFGARFAPQAQAARPPAGHAPCRRGPHPILQVRFYDFNVWTAKKRVEKLNYMHQNPVKRGLAMEPEDWRWSSFRFYSLGETGRVVVNESWAQISFRDGWLESLELCRQRRIPPFRKTRKGRGTHLSGTGCGGQKAPATRPLQKLQRESFRVARHSGPIRLSALFRRS